MIQVDPSYVSYTIELDITPQPTPRGRASYNPYTKKTTVHNPKKYTAYKNALGLLIKSKYKKQEGRLVGILVHIHRSIPKYLKNKVNIGDEHLKKPDSDNYLKAVKDACEKAGIIRNDSEFAFSGCYKTYQKQEGLNITFIWKTTKP